MTAQTGKTYVPMQPVRREAFMQPLPEASAQTHPAGAILQTSSGSLISASSNACPTSFWGVAAAAGANSATHGAKNANNFRFQQGPGHEFSGVLAGTLGTANIGATAAISVYSNGFATLTTGTGVSNSSTVRVMRPAPGWNIGDVNAIVYFIPLDAAIQ